MVPAMFQPVKPKNKVQAPPGIGIKKNPIGACGNKYEKAPMTANIAPEAPNEAEANEDLINVGMAIETNEDRTAALRYNTVKLATPTVTAKDVPNDCNTNMFTKLSLIHI